MSKTAWLVIAVMLGWFLATREGSIHHGPGVFAPDPPVQKNIEASETYSIQGYTLTPLARFHIKAKVLARENYHLGRESDLSPVDLALGWGRMSDERVLESITVRQSGRWYHWRSDDLPIPVEEIATHSANMHLVPRNKEVEDAIMRARRGDIVEFSGSLVKIEAGDGWKWVSSLSRNDRGVASCELVWVDDFVIHHR